MKVLGIDIGGSGVKGAIVDTELGELVSERHRIPTPHPAKPEAVAKTVQKDRYQCGGTLFQFDQMQNPCIK